TFVLIFFYAAFELLAAGTGPLIARATGAEDTITRRALLGEALFGALLLTGGAHDRRHCRRSTHRYRPRA
ncbi:MAG TPA: hypothetical protein VE965_04990, partial [Gammaproteobacteria bacterium]|nr:hypothetical protein [Gammaproteobacteria bacterium]